MLLPGQAYPNAVAFYFIGANEVKQGSKVLHLQRQGWQMLEF
jgi:hypothetical protein